MMKLFFSIFMLLALSSCHKELSLDDVSSSSLKSDIEVANSSIETFEQLLNSNAGKFVEIPVGHKLLREEWEYNKVYHFQTKAGEVHEIYTFDGNSDAYTAAKATCDKVYSSVLNSDGTTTISCELFGKTCGYTLDNCGNVCISVCLKS